MTNIQRTVRLGAFAAVFLAAVAMVSCSSGSLNSTPLAVATATSSPTSNPSSTATAAPTSVASSAVLATTTTFASVAGIGLSITFTGAPNPAGVSFSTVSYNSAQPAAVPTNAPGSQPSPGAGVTPVVVFAETFNATTTVTIPNNPTQTFTGVPALPAGKSYYTYFADLTAATPNGYSGPFAATNGTVAAVPGGSNPGTQTLTAGHVYLTELVYF